MCRTLYAAWSTWLVYAARKEDFKLKLLGAITVLQNRRLHATWLSWRSAAIEGPEKRAKVLHALILMQKLYLHKGFQVWLKTQFFTPHSKLFPHKFRCCNRTKLRFLCLKCLWALSSSSSSSLSSCDGVCYYYYYVLTSRGTARS